MSSHRLPLSAHAISFGYQQQPILHGLDFQAEKGKLTILVGANGCGKSTLLKVLARIHAPTQGQVYLKGDNIHRLKTKDVAKAMGLLPQGPSAPEGLKVRELVAQGRFPHQSLLRQWSKEDEQAVDQAMRTAKVEQFAERQVDDLSGGQRQRCWIAMVLAQQTDLILLDEPTTFLDLKVQVDLMQLLQQLAHEHGRTLVVVLHELNLAAAYADHLVMMKAGNILAQGHPREVFTSDHLKQVFDLDAHVLVDPGNDSLVCVPCKTRLHSIPAAQAKSA